MLTEDQIARIEKIQHDNSIARRYINEGLTTSEISDYSGYIMWGIGQTMTCSQEEWSAIVD